MTAHLLVVEDDLRQSGLLATALRHGGYRVTRAFDAAEATEAVSTSRPDLVVLDLGLPDRSGLDVLSELRAHDTAVIVVTGRGDVVDRVLGIEMGADDYLVKPVELRELLARVRRVLARSAIAVAPAPEVGGSIEINGLRIDPDTREATADGSPLTLTRREFDLLTHLARQPKRVFDRERLLRDVWRTDPSLVSRSTVTEHVRRLRTKLGAVTGVRLETVRGVGYRLRPIHTPTAEVLP